MKGNKVTAGLLSAVLLGTAIVPSTMVTLPADAASEAVIIYSNDFENGNVSDFTGRGGVETIAAVTDKASSGSKSMCVSNREKSWNGPQFAVDAYCEAGVEYTVSAAVCTEWYNNINMSMEYTDAGGVRHYSNLKSVVSQGEWQNFEDVKFSFTSDVSNVYIYFECGDTANIYVDDFVLKSAATYDIQTDIASLKDVYADYFKIGTACGGSELTLKTTQDLILKHFNSITTGNEMKPDALLDREASIAEGSNVNPQVDLSAARSALNFARDNNIPMRGHVLVWHQQTPDWFFRENYEEGGAWVSKEVMLQRLENYIKNVFAALEAEYPEVEFYAYDVVNECYLDDGSARKPGANSGGEQTSPWVQIFGDNSFIESAFEFARKYAPEGTKLYYNDYNEYMPSKTAAIVEMATNLKEKGLIDGIGCQSHLDVSFPGVSAYEKAIKAFAETGLDIQITELDATTTDVSETGFETQAKYYSDIMDVLVKYSDSISAVVLWGTTDDKSWRADRCPLIFNGDYTAKPAYYAIIDGIESSGTTTTPTETTTTTTETTTTEITTTTEEITTTQTTTTTENITTTESTSDICIMTTTTSTETTSGSSAEASLIGDANADGKISMVDLVHINKFVAKLVVFNEVQTLNADCYADGIVNGSDAAALLQYLLSVINSLPVQP